MFNFEISIALLKKPKEMLIVFTWNVGYSCISIQKWLPRQQIKIFLQMTSQNQIKSTDFAAISD